MQIEDYRVRLEAFDGPLDLLLYLIRRAEVDVTNIPIATIAEQYVAYLRGIDRIDIDVAGEFLVMAATLMEIKSRMLMPRAERAEDHADEPPHEDPRGELVRQLLAYKRNRDAAGMLEDRHRAWQRRWPIGRAGIGKADESSAKPTGSGLFEPDSNAANETPPEHAPPEVDLGDLELIDLARAYARIAAAVDFTRLGEHRVAEVDIPIEILAEDLVSRLAQGAIIVDDHGRAHRRMALAQAFLDRPTAEAVGVFLAMLELVRQGRLRVFQHAAEDPIVVELIQSE